MSRTRMRRGVTALVLTLGLLAPVEARAQATNLGVRLLQAVKKGDAATVRTLIRQRADVNVAEGDGATPLLWAAYRSDVEIVRLLLAAGARATVTNRLGVTPLLQASRVGDAAVVQALLQAGADPRVPGPEGETTLMAAAGSGSVETVRLLLARGVPINAVEQWQGQTALMWAAGEGHADVVRVLVEARADLNMVAKPSALEHRPSAFRGRSFVDHASGGLTALMMAAREGHTDAARILADAGADLNVANPDSATALMIAVINDRFDLSAMLLDKGANADDGSLYQAVEMHNMSSGNVTTGEATRKRLDHPNTLTSLDLIERLLARGANPNRLFTHTLHFLQTRTPSAPNLTPMYRAAQAGDVAALRLMLAKGGDPNLILSGGAAPAGGRGGGPPADTPLIAAIGTGGGGARGGGGGGGGGRGAAAPQFREAAVRDNVEAVKVLLAGGADANKATAAGDTALHRAAQAGNVAVIQLLADAGARLDVTNKAGLTPLDVAMGRQPAGDAAPAPAAGGLGGRGAAGPMPQPRAIALLRQLMGLPPAAPEDLAPAAGPRGRGGRGGQQ